MADTQKEFGEVIDEVIEGLMGLKFQEEENEEG